MAQFSQTDCMLLIILINYTGIAVKLIKKDLPMGDKFA